MRTYGELFRVPEFTSLFVASAAQVAASTVTGLALATLVYSATGSPLLSALVMFGPSLAQVAGASVLLSAADQIPPRAALTALALLFAAGSVAQARPGIGVGVILAIGLALGVASSLGGGVLYGLLNEIVPPNGYMLGRSVLNMSVGIMQIVGFATGGVLVTFMSARGTLLAGAGLYVLSGLLARFGLSRRPARAQGRPSPVQTWRNNVLLLSSAPRRYVYLGLCVPNGLIVGCESLFVSYSPRHAGTLFACTAVGMLAGDTLAGRFVSERWRDRLGPWLRLLLACPYLVFLAHPALVLACAVCAVASVGYCATLMLQQRLIALTPDDLKGHALGLHSSCMLAMQGVGAALAGTVAECTSPAIGITAMAAASVAVTLALARGATLHTRPASTAPRPPTRSAGCPASKPASPASATATRSPTTPPSPCGPPPTASRPADTVAVMARVILMCGPAGSGKSTIARRYEQQGMTRLSFDQEAWSRGITTMPLPADVRRDIEATLRARLVDLVRNGTDVVLDFSFWSRRTRDDYRALLRPLGVVPETVYLATDRATALERVAARAAGHGDDFQLSPELAAAYFDHFEVPTPDEGPLTVLR